MQVRTGLDTLVAEGFRKLKGKTIGVLCNQASVDSNLDHILDLLLPLHRSGFLRIAAVFGPQHGLRGHTQDNMVEWEGDTDHVHGWRVCSLYGEHREPTSEMLEGIEVLVVDLQDVGSRYYTFLWTLSLCLKACGERLIHTIILDRPNPIGGDRTEGPFASPEYASFVGLKPLLVRHGLTMGELALWLRTEHYPKSSLEIIPVFGWERSMAFTDTRLPWIPPSPNMPTPMTAEVYPGGCLLEGTNLSEGRGTTRPFEVVGAPFLNSDRFAAALNALALPGVKFLPYDFQPTFQKHAGQTCGGVFQWVTDRTVFESVLSTTALLLEVRRQAPSDFAWRSPPYEYEFEKLPIDILTGGSWYRQWIEEGVPLAAFRERFASDSVAHTLEELWLYGR